MPTHYEILDISSSATQDDIKKAYRKKAFQYHPDRNASKDTSEKMQEINLAYETLSDSSKRSAYDSSIGLRNKNGRSYWDSQMFDDLFREAYTSSNQGSDTKFRWDSYKKSHYQQPKTPPKCDSLRVTINITLSEAYYGVEKTIIIEKTVDGKKVSEEVKFVIPRWCENGKSITITGEGNRKTDYVNGDLIVVVNYRVPSNISIDDYGDTVIKHNVSIIDFILLKEIEIPTPMYKCRAIVHKLTELDRIYNEIVIGEGFGLNTEMKVVYVLTYPELTKENIELLNKIK